MVVPPKKKYEELSVDSRKLVDFMIDQMLDLMDREPELAADVLHVPPEERRPAIIELFNVGVIKLASDLKVVWWEIYAMATPGVPEYIPLGGRHLSPERN